VRTVGKSAYAATAPQPQPPRDHARTAAPLRVLALGLACGAAALLVRGVLDAPFPELSPFATLLPAALLATLWGGWRSGSLTAAVGFAGAWYWFLPERSAFAFGSPSEAANLCLAVAATLVIVAAVERRMRSARLLEAESARGAVERRLSRLLELVPVAVTQIDPSGRIVYANPAAGRVLGIEPDKAEAAGWKGAAFSPHYPGGDLVPRSEFPSAKALKGGSVTDFRADIVRLGSGEHAALSISSVPLHDDHGRITGALCVFTDLTERERARQALAETEERFRLMADTSPAPIWVTDANGHVEFVNRTCAEFLGAAPEDLTGDRWLDRLHPEDRPAVLEGRAAAWRDRSPYAFEARFRDAAGCWRWIIVTSAPRLAPEGRLDGFVGIAHDVTERRAAEKALQESETRLRLAVAAAGAGVWEWRLDTNEMIYSARAREICGFPADGPVTYEMVAGVTHPDDFPQTRAQSRRALDPAIRDRSPYEYRLLLPDGQVRWVLAHGEATWVVRDGVEQAVRYVGTLLDVTERHEADERLRLLAREVDHRANNLLQVVQSAVVLSQASDTDELKRVIGGRLQALARAHQLLSASRWQTTSVRRLLEEELKPFGLGDTAAVTLAGPDLPVTPAEAQALGLCVHELATNAAKYGALSREGGVVVVELSLGPDGSRRVDWIERGGPPVTVPTRRGFGSSVIRRALSGPIGGEVLLDWRPEGLRCALILAPGAKLESDPAAPRSPAA
jgi:PAS domain S-box-containing protein